MNNWHLTKIKQTFPDKRITNLEDEVRKEIVKFGELIKPGKRIAIAAGSRGINNLATVVREVAEYVRARDAFPFIVPAMGSHGDASASGQAEILESYGITEKLIGVPVISSMDVVELPFAGSPVQVFMDKNAYSSDGVILINRIKPHTDFHGTWESGLVKMSVIGLGKERQASVIHSFGVFGLTDIIPEIAKKILSSGKILGGIGLVENAYDETMVVKALKPEEFFDQEAALLAIARNNMPSLPVKDIDVLIIDRLGKDISGTGIDPNIIGRMRIMGQKEPENPRIKAIVVTDLTEATHGNAIGIGLSDVITRKLYDKIDFSSTYINAVTSSFIERAKIPIIAKNEREAFAIALRSCGYLKSGMEKIVRIKDTLHLGEVLVSHAVLDSIDNGNAIVLNNVPLFNSRDELQPF